MSIQLSDIAEYIEELHFKINVSKLQHLSHMICKRQEKKEHELLEQYYLLTYINQYIVHCYLLKMAIAYRLVIAMCHGAPEQCLYTTIFRYCRIEE